MAVHFVGTLGHIHIGANRVIKNAFSKDKRLLNAKDYQAVFDNNQWKVSNKEMLILARHNGSSTPRLGLVIAKKHIKLAVSRNRIKRLVRESFRLQQAELAGLDIVVLIRSPIDPLDSKSIRENLSKLWQRLLKKSQHRENLIV